MAMKDEHTNDAQNPELAEDVKIVDCPMSLSNTVEHLEKILELMDAGKIMKARKYVSLLRMSLLQNHSHMDTIITAADFGLYEDD